jgi:hypothetical protein
MHGALRAPSVASHRACPRSRSHVGRAPSSPAASPLWRPSRKVRPQRLQSYRRDCDGVRMDYRRGSCFCVPAHQPAGTRPRRGDGFFVRRPCGLARRARSMRQRPWVDSMTLAATRVNLSHPRAFVQPSMRTKPALRRRHTWGCQAARTDPTIRSLTPLFVFIVAWAHAGPAAVPRLAARWLDTRVRRGRRQGSKSGERRQHGLVRLFGDHLILR